jgi:hypothetical protein
MGVLTLSDAQELVELACRSLGLSKAPKVTDKCPWAPQYANGKVVGAFHPSMPDTICVRSLNPGTILHELGHWYYHWYVAPVFGRYDEDESEALANKFERMASKISFDCRVCGGAVLMKTEKPHCGHCGAIYQVAEEALLGKALLFGSIALFWSWAFTNIAKIGMVPITEIIRARKKGEEKRVVYQPPSPVLVGMVSSVATYLTYRWAKARLGLS